MKHGAIFDMDGLLFDTEKLYRKAWGGCITEFGIERVPALESAVSGTSGEGMRAVVRKYYPTVDVEAYIKRVIETVEADMKTNLTMMKGVREILAFFKSEGVKIAVASSSPTDIIEDNLNRSGIKDYFNVTVGGNQVTNGKPAPDIFLKAAEKIQIDPIYCYVFEDSFNGIRAAHAAKCTPVMIPDTVQPDEEIRKIAGGIYPSLLEAMIAIQNGEI